MDQDEAAANRYLKNLSFSTVVYEPDGNVTPDFLCDGRVAVEVRRLNQLEDSITGNNTGIEVTSIPLLRVIRKILPELGPPLNSRSWNVTYVFKRPKSDWEKVPSLVRAALEEFRDRDTHVRSTITVTPELKLLIHESPSTNIVQFFVLGGYNDEDSGGCLFTNMQKSLDFTIKDKTKKILKVKHKYPEWWLVLVDHVTYGMDEFDFSLFEGAVNAAHDFDKLILISPREGFDAFEI